MKYIILFLISFNANAYWITLEDFEKCRTEQGGHVFHVHRKTCKGECVEIPNANCPVFETADEMVNGEAIYSKKENVTDCETKKECEELRDDLCKDLVDHEFFYAENIIIPGYEAYCTKVTGYEKVKSGRKIIKLNAQKKAAYDTALQEKRAQLEAEALEEKEIKEVMRELAVKEIGLKKAKK